jgi:5-methyltetrahydropteroyltriglutamate--homocysteine methyltransferase
MGVEGDHMGRGKTSNLGYPRIDENREWKKALESYWAGKGSEPDLLACMEKIRLAHLGKQKEKGIDYIPVGDFTMYDHMLDMAAMFGLVPKRFGYAGGPVSLDTYFAMARGKNDAVACEMTKWFTTNYHYIVPEWNDARPVLTENKPLQAFLEAKEKLAIWGKPVMVGPYTFVKLSKGISNEADILSQLLPLYIRILQELDEAGAEWVQMDEPILVTSLSREEMEQVVQIYTRLQASVPSLKIMLQTYFDAVEWYEELIRIPVKGIGLDFVHGREENMANLQRYGFPSDKILGAGLIDGRNVWKADLLDTYTLLQGIYSHVSPERVWLQPSCSLMHVPVNLKQETQLDPHVKQALSFAEEKLDELVSLQAIAEMAEEEAMKHAAQSKQALEQLAVFRSGDKSSEEDIPDARHLPYEARKAVQQQYWRLPLLPTTTIGSFPQTAEVRKARLQWRKGEWTDEAYQAFIQQEIKRWIEIQEEIGLDVLVHGEFERTDMVEFFAEKMSGFAFTQNGWVQSYGSRCVRPPILYGDVSFVEPMTVKETVYAQSLTSKPVKGMLTGPVTIINWSFVRNDIPKQEVAYQISRALRKEVELLEEAGIKIIQVDEPALREGLPLKKSAQDAYLEWAVKAFRLVTSSVQDTTQIHTHMCYCEFQDFIGAIRELDADVISVETSRSHGELIASFERDSYEKAIGLGVYDIHSPRIPPVEEMVAMIERAIRVIDPAQFWINPDCGLKTRHPEETIASLKHMVEAAHHVRTRLSRFQQA